MVVSNLAVVTVLTHSIVSFSLPLLFRLCDRLNPT